jgi:GAF domain-containing protein
MNQQQKSTDKVNVQSKESPLPFWRQLRWNLILYFIALAVIPLAIVITIVLNQVGQQAEAQISRQLESIAELKIDQIDRWLADSDLTLDYFLSTPIRDKLVTFVTAATLDQPEQDQFNQLFSETLAKHNHEAHPETQEHGQFLELFVYNTKGDIIAGSDPGRVGQIVSNQPYFAASLVGDALQPPYYELGQSELTMIVTKVLRDKQRDQIVGVLAGRLDLNALSEVMAVQTGLGESGETYLVSPENNYLVTASRFESAGYTRSRAYHSEGIDQALAGENGSAVYPNYREPAETVIGVYRWLPNLQVGLLAEVAEDEALAPFAAVRNFSLSLAAAAILIAIAVGLYSAARISRPIASLTQVANRITSGDLEQRAEITERNEFGLLATAFNAMTAQLRELIGSLEERIAARTHRLEIAATMGERMNAILNVDQLLAEVVNQIKESFDYYHAHIYLLDNKGERLVVAEGTGLAGVEMKAQAHNIHLDAPQSLVARAARTGEIVKVDNVREVKDWLPNPLLPDTYSEMAVPIILEEQVVGVLDVQQNKIAGLDEGDASLLRSLANQVAVAMHNSRLFAEVETALSEARVAQARYLEQAWEKSKIEIRGRQYHYARPGAPILAETVLAKAKQHAVAQSGPAIVAISENDAVENSKSTVEPLGEAEQARAIVAPIILHDLTIGTLQLHPAHVDQVWTEADVAITEAVINQLVQTAEHLRLFEETRERAGREQTIREITDKLRAAPNLQQLAIIATRELNEKLGGMHAGLELGIKSQTTLGNEPQDKIKSN